MKCEFCGQFMREEEAVFEMHEACWVAKMKMEKLIKKDSNITLIKINP